MSHHAADNFLMIRAIRVHVPAHKRMIILIGLLDKENGIRLRNVVYSLGGP